MEEQVKRGPGRPAKQEDTLKKGNSSWTPASLNEFTNKEPGYRYRMSHKDPQNLSKKHKEGWENVSKLDSAQTKYVEPNKIEHGKPLSSIYEGHDWVLQRIPEEVAQGRDAYFNNETERRTAGLTAHIKKEMSKEGAGAHGDITISSRKNTQTI